MSIGASPLITPLALLLASFLMVLTGSAKKRLVMKSSVCPVCHRDRKSCTCHWL